MAVELLTPGVIKTRELLELFEKYGIKVGDKVGNASRLAGVYGVKRPKEVKVQYRGQSPTTVKNPTQFYTKPTDSQLKQIKKQYDINQLKKTSSGPGKIAFDKRNKRAKELLKTGKYTIGQANEKLKLEFPEIKKTGMQTTLSKLAKNIKGIPSGTTGDTSLSIIKVKKDLEKLNKSEVKDLLKAGNKNLQSLINKTSKILGRDKSLATRRIGQLIEAYRGDDRYIKVKDDLLVRRVQPLIKGLGKIEGTKLFGGIGGGLQRMAAEGEAAKSIGETRSFFSSLRKRIQEALPKSGYETDEIKNIRSSARFGTGPYSMFVQGIKSDINQDKMKSLDKQTSIYEKRLQAAKPEDKPRIAKEYNTKARKFAAEANKNLKPGQPPIRVLEISFDEPNKVIKNKYALDNYGDLFDDIYQKHGYSFKVPADVKTIQEVKPFLEGGRGLKKAAQLIRAGAPRIFAIPAAAYLGYQALGSSELEAAEPDIKYNPEIGAIVKSGTDEVESQGGILNWMKDNPMKSLAGTAGITTIGTKAGRGLLMNLLGTLGTPVAGGALAGYTIKKNMDEGKNIADATIDKVVGADLMLTGGVNKALGSTRLASLLGGAKLARSMTPIGAGITALGLGKDYVNFASDEIERINNMTPEEREEYNIAEQEQMGISA